MSKIKKILKNVRVIILLVFIVLAILAIKPSFESDGVAIRNVVQNSSVSLAGIEKPVQTTSPMSREKIIAIDNVRIKTLQDYENAVKDLGHNDTIIIRTNIKSYKVETRPLTKTTILGEMEFIEVPKMITITEEVNGTNVTRTIPEIKVVEEIINHTKYVFGTNESYIEQETVRTEIPVTELKEVNKTLVEILGTEDIGLKVFPAPQSNIRKGLDLQGGTRVLLTPASEISPEDMEILLANLDQRLNVYGISDVIVKDASDLSGNQYIVVEIAGANEEEVKDLLAKQGKFEAKIGNETAFRGGTDINFVCRSSDCAGIDPTQGCGKNGELWFCRFQFSITVSQEAAERQARLTSELSVISGQGGDGYLSKTIDFYLDDQKVDALNIGASLQGQAVTDIAISGSGNGITRQEAISNSIENMKSLQTIMITGSLPIKLNIVKTDSISPILGKEFIRNSIKIAIFAMLAVTIVVMIRYRKVQIALPMLFTMVSELIMLLGVAALIGWNLDLAAIAGIIIVIGSGVDHLIVITDETLKGQGDQYHNWKEKIKKAFFIIMAAYFTTLVAMFPLLFAGAGLLKGFALTTIIGISIGVFIARPAYASIVEILLKE